MSRWYFNNQRDEGEEVTDLNAKPNRMLDKEELRKAAIDTLNKRFMPNNNN